MSCDAGLYFIQHNSPSMLIPFFFTNVVFQNLIFGPFKYSLRQPLKFLKLCVILSTLGDNHVSVSNKKLPFYCKLLREYFFWKCRRIKNDRVFFELFNFVYIKDNRSMITVLNRHGGIFFFGRFGKCYQQRFIICKNGLV